MNTATAHEEYDIKKTFSLFYFDDDEVYLDLIAKRFEAENYIIDTSSTMEDAINNIDSNSYDAYLIDMETPKDRTAGIKLIKRIRESGHTSLVDIISAHTQYRKKLDDIGANAYTEKPIENFHAYAVELRNKLLQTFDSKQEDIELTLYLINLVETLNESEETRRIVLDIFGRELPTLKNKVDELRKLNEVTDSYITRAKRMITNGEALIEEAYE